jgi:hypothetical protein
MKSLLRTEHVKFGERYSLQIEVSSQKKRVVGIGGEKVKGGENNVPDWRVGFYLLFFYSPRKTLFLHR